MRQQNIVIVGVRSYNLLSERRQFLLLDHRHIGSVDQEGQNLSADNLPPKSRNLSTYITECGSSVKFEILLEKCQLIERRIIVVLS